MSPATNGYAGGTGEIGNRSGAVSFRVWTSSEPCSSSTCAFYHVGPSRWTKQPFTCVFLL